MKLQCNITIQYPTIPYIILHYYIPYNTLHYPTIPKEKISLCFTFSNNDMHCIHIHNVHTYSQT